MRVLFIFILTLFVFMPPVQAAEEGERKILYWVAPMDPNYRQSGPGKSPMGMDLIPVYEDEAQGESDAPENAVKIDPVYQQNLGVKTGVAEIQEFGKTIHAYGHIAPSTRLEHSVDMRAAGWVVELATDAVGDEVKKGDLLFTYYSPDLMQAQSDALIGGRIGNAEQRLRLYGMDEKAIAALEKAGRFLEETPFYAPVDGTVASLNVRKGAHVAEGGTILSLQDYSQVWVEAHLPVRELAFIAVGTPATILLDQTGERFPATVDYIHPNTDPQSRTGMVRLVLENPEGRLKTDTLVDVMFEADSAKRLAVPAQAVLYGGAGAYVIEALGKGYFRPAMVETGITASGMTEITGGLTAGQKIVTSGQFMIDAESNLRGGLAAMTGEAPDKAMPAIDHNTQPMPGMDHQTMDHEDMDHKAPPMDHSSHEMEMDMAPDTGMEMEDDMSEQEGVSHEHQH